MTDEIRETNSPNFPSSLTRAPRQIIEDVFEILRSKDSLSDNARTRFDQSIRLLDECIGSRKENYAYADAVERAPWLTSDVEQLKRQWKELRRSLRLVHMRARRGGCSHKLLIKQYEDFAERFFECEADEECFLQAAFPGPDWTEESPGIHSF